MSLAKITLYGMARWMQESQDDLFANMTLPTGWDKDLLVDTIMLHGAEFEVLYAEPQFMKNAIGIWSDKWYFTLDRWLKALSIEYNPLENYDRMEDYSDVGTKGRTDSRNKNETGNRVDSQNLRSTSNTVDSSANGTKHGSETEHQVSAYNSGTYQPSGKDKVTNDNTDSTMNSSTLNANRSGTASTSADSRHDVETGSETEHNLNSHHGRLHGNIGVTTSQQMLESELDIARFNMYEEAANLFLTELVIYTY